MEKAKVLRELKEGTARMISDVEFYRPKNKATDEYIKGLRDLANYCITFIENFIE